MAAFTSSALEKRLRDLDSSQNSIETLSLWLIHHRKHHKIIVEIWLRQLKKTSSNRKLAFIYLANDVIQNSKRKGPEFSREFCVVLDKAFRHICRSVSDPQVKHSLDLIIRIWEERQVYKKSYIESFRTALKEQYSKEIICSSQKKVSNSRDEEIFKGSDMPPAQKKLKITISESIKFPAGQYSCAQDLESIKFPAGQHSCAQDLIQALKNIEDCPSRDEVIREKIETLPPEVSGFSLLDNIQDFKSAEKLSKQLDEAYNLLSEYNTRLIGELEDRRRLLEMLNAFTQEQEKKLASVKQRAQEYRNRQKGIVQVRNELEVHREKLPDLVRLPCVTGDLPPLTSGEDLFNEL